MKKTKGKLLISGGLLLLAAALFLTCYNIWEAKKASDTARKALEPLEKKIEANRNSALEEEQEEVTERPLYEQYPDMEMPVAEIDGREYIGVLGIASLNLKLPVLSGWSYPGLRVAPCRYKGSAYSHDLIVAAHNYSSHFGNLKTLEPGEEVLFTDVQGNQFFYEVAEMEELPGTAVEDMEAGEWDMTLFTCTLGGRSRVTLRCRLLSSVPAGE